MTVAEFHPIGVLETPHRNLTHVPSQASESTAVARVVVEPRYVDAMLGLDRYDHLWLITWLERQPDVRPLQVHPRSTEATGELQGVFACRFPVRPNPIGLSLVRRLATRANVITVHGADLLDGTPVLDIKPWFADCDDPRNLEDPGERPSHFGA
jgi:tRNA-Thr(GGU) m(6)t(6)A37 methyltransferase TsaA